METKIGVGEWKMRNGRKAVIIGTQPGNPGFPWIGYRYLGDGSTSPYSWSDRGWNYASEETELISPWTSPIAPGHNPDKLTVDQVGDGWWLPEWEVLEKVGKHLIGHFQYGWLGKWYDMQCIPSEAGHLAYRTHLPRAELLALIAPKKRLIRVEELPPVCWVSIGDGCGDWLVTQRTTSMIGHSTELYTIEQLNGRGRKWSSDLRTWNSFEVEDKQ